MTPRVDGPQGVAVRRPERRDVRLPADGLFDVDRARELWESLPVEQRLRAYDVEASHFTFIFLVLSEPERDHVATFTKYYSDPKRAQ